MKRLVWIVFLMLFLTGLCWAADYGNPLGEYKGVIAYHNGEPAGNANGDYQCVEYVRRFYREVYQQELGPVGGAAKHAFEDRYWAGLEEFIAYPQGSTTLPMPDDIICYSGGGYGHVAIVIEATSTKVRVIEQNFSTKTCFGEMTVENREGYFLSDRGKYHVEGWIHYKKATIRSEDKRISRGLQPINSQATLSSENGDAISIILESVTDFTLTYDVNVRFREGSVYFRIDSERRPIEGLPTEGMNGYGVVFCPFARQGANQGLYIVKRVNGIERTLAYERRGFPRINGNTRLTVSVEDSKIKVYENGNLILSAEDDSFSRGRLQWRVYGEPREPAKAHFKLISLEGR